MDAGLNEPFKERICHEAEHFLTIKPIGMKPGCTNIGHWIANTWNNIPSHVIIDAWRHISHIQGETAACPMPFVEEDNNEHNPLALNNGNTEHERDSEVHNSNDTKDWWAKNDHLENHHLFIPAIAFQQCLCLGQTAICLGFELPATILGL